MQKIFTLMFICLFTASFAFGQHQLKKDNKKEKFTTKNLLNQTWNYKNLAHDKFDFHLRDMNKPDLFKKSNGTMQRLDSLVSFDPSVSQFSYKSSFEYNTDGNNTLWVSYVWIGYWMADYIDHYTYDGDGNLSAQWFEYWSEEDEAWHKDGKFDYTYDSDGSLSTSNLYTWNDDTMEWEIVGKIEYFYDGEGMLTHSVTSSLDEGVWVDQLKNEFTYDGDGNLTEMLMLIYFIDEWMEMEKTIYTYDGNGNLTEEVQYSWEFMDNDWLPWAKYNYTYNGNGNNTSIIYSDWVDMWVLIDKEEYNFDGNGNISSQMYYIWDEVSETWQQDNKTDINYNNNYTFNDLILPYFYTIEIPELFNHMITDATSYNWDGGDWLANDETSFYYSEQTITDVADLQTEGLSIYPNPATDYITVDFTENNTTQFDIYDIQGRMVLSREISGKTNIGVSHLDKGLYIYQLLQNGQAKSGKFLIE